MFSSKAAALLRQLLREQTQQAVAEALGVQQSTVSGYARGRCRPTLTRALVLQDRFGIPVQAWGAADESAEAISTGSSRPRGVVTAKQQQLLDFIVAYTASHAQPPTMREMSEAIGTKTPNSVAGHLLRLQRAGVVTWEINKPRTVRVIARPAEAAAE